jgi:MoxR-like ATPase
MNNKIDILKKEIGKIIVGQEDLVESLLIGLISGGHILVEGVPGLAKTTAINALSKSIGLDFNRIQFTPDLLPSDVVGTEVYNQKDGTFSVRKGPVFTNLLLADEINRAPAKVQSALLEVMQEKQITISDTTFKLDEPFLVMATENPVEQEGTYRLPEAQLDRFMMKVMVDYNTPQEEFEIVQRVAKNGFEEVNQVATVEDIMTLKDELKLVHVDDEVQRYMINIVFATRDPKKYGIPELEGKIEFGASPRASIDMYKASRAMALLRGKDFVTPLDVAKVVTSILRHRIVLSYQAESSGLNSDKIVEQIINSIKIP